MILKLLLCEEHPSLLCVVGLPFVVVFNDQKIKIKLLKTKTKGLQFGPTPTPPPPSWGICWGKWGELTLGFGWKRGLFPPQTSPILELTELLTAFGFSLDGWVAIHWGNSSALHYWGDT